MKKYGKIWLAFLLCLCFSVTVSADVQKGKTKPDYATDYYMIVESKPGGIHIYANPDLESARLDEELISNGTALYIEGEVSDEANNRTWGYITYHGMKGFVALDDCRPAKSRKEAIDSELYIAGRDHVNYNADYEITAYTKEGTQKLYQGPGEKYGEVPGVRDIRNGDTLHITQEAEMVDGSRWGVTTVDGKEGWVNLDNTEEASLIPMETLAPSATAAPSVTEKPSVTAAPSVTETPSATAVPSVTEMPSATATPSAADASEEAKEMTSTSTETQQPSDSGEPAEEIQPESAEEVSGSQVTEETESQIPTPFLWIVAATVAAVAGIIIYHFKKR